MSHPPFTYTWIEPDRVMAGSIPFEPTHIKILASLGIKRVLTLTRRNPSTYPNMDKVFWDNGILPLQCSIPDNGIPEHEQLASYASIFIKEATDAHLPVYVHCRGGIGRTGIILQRYYMEWEGYTLDQARQKVSVRRNYEGNADASQQGSPQKEWIEAYARSIGKL